MWDFPRYTSGERAFNFSRDTSVTAGTGTGAGAGAGAGARASRTVLRIRCKSSSEYLGILVSAGGFGPGGPLGYSEISDLGDREESGRALEGATEGATEGAIEEATEGTTKGATEGAMERRSRRGRPRPRTTIILALTF